MSNLGRKDRQIWYDFHSKVPPEPISAATRIKFLYGEIIERILLFLAKEAGHKVTEEQKELEIDGIKGHQDCLIDGVVTDIKSCSSYSFKKFQKGDLEDDPFGYEAQLAGYSEANNGMDGAFLAIDKQNGDLTLLPITGKKLSEYKIKDRIAHLREVIKSETPPERCYPDKPFGKSDNRCLSIGCQWCNYRRECWADANNNAGLRTFLYSTGPVDFTEINTEPRVSELGKE